MPDKTNDFLTTPLTYASFNSGASAINPTTANLDSAAGVTGQTLTATYTIPPTPAGSPDNLWDSVTFTYTWSSTNTSVSSAYDGAWVRLGMYTENSTISRLTPIPNGSPQGNELITDAAARNGTVSGTSTVTFFNIAPGTYRLFVGEANAGDGEQLAVSVISGQAIEAVPCFANGTMIATANGAVAVENLKVGDLVLTRDNGLQPIRWLGSRKLNAFELSSTPNLLPIRIRAGALGFDLPSADLIVSPQHRILVQSAIAQRMFGSYEVLVAAKQLTEIPGIEVAIDIETVEYFHILFDHHEIILSNGAETESLYTGHEALQSIGKAAREEIFTLFPELRDNTADSVSAAILIRGRKARSLASRHAKNRQPLVA